MYIVVTLRGGDNSTTCLQSDERTGKPMVLPVKVSLVNTTAFAHTIDISYAGARIGDIHDQLKPEETISVMRGSNGAPE